MIRIRYDEELEKAREEIKALRNEKRMYKKAALDWIKEYDELKAKHQSKDWAYGGDGLVL